LKAEKEIAENFTISAEKTFTLERGTGDGDVSAFFYTFGPLLLRHCL